jgi:integrase
MATLWRRKLKGGYIYYVDYMYNGKRYRESTKTDDGKLAELFLKDIEVKIARDNFGLEDLTNKKRRVKEFFDKYLKYSKANKAENTYLLDSYSLGNFENFTNNIQLGKVNANIVEEYKIKRLTEVKATSVNLEIRHLKAAFEKAVKWDFIQKNPFKEVKQIKIKGNNLPKYLSKEQVNTLLSTIPDGLFKNLILFYLYTGCRRGEALRLEWKDINMESERVTVGETKSGESRVIPINKELFKVLSSMDRNGNRLFPFNPWYVTHKFKQYIKRTKIPVWEQLTIHSLRHTFASHLVMDGTDLYSVSKLLGHSSVKVTEMYAHLAPDYLKVSINRLKF